MKLTDMIAELDATTTIADGMKTIKMIEPVYVQVPCVNTIVPDVTPDPVVESPKVVAENAKRAAAGKPRMTAAEAKHFDLYSETNAGIVEEAAAVRGCECVAYESIFTFQRWIAQGRVVKKGEKGTFIDIPNFREVVDEATGQKKKIKVGSRRVAVFCRCQTKKLEPKAKAAA